MSAIADPINKTDRIGITAVDYNVCRVIIECLSKIMQLEAMNIKTNRRGRSRQSVNIEGEYYYAKTWTHCEIYDLSTEGAALKLKQSFVIRDKIKIRIIDAANHVFEARVVNVNGCRTGIAFEDIQEQGKAAIENVISRHGMKAKPVARYAAAAFERAAE